MRPLASHVAALRLLREVTALALIHHHSENPMSDPAAAIAMRELPEETRDALIAEGPNVHDLRPVLHVALKSREIAKTYRSPKKPNAPRA